MDRFSDRALTKPEIRSASEKIWEQFSEEDKHSFRQAGRDFRIGLILARANGVWWIRHSEIDSFYVSMCAIAACRP